MSGRRHDCPPPESADQVVYLRAHTELPESAPRGRRGHGKPGYVPPADVREVIVLGEPVVDAEQRLLFMPWVLARDRARGRGVDGRCVLAEVGLICADDLAGRAPDVLEALEDHAADHRGRARLIEAGYVDQGWPWCEPALHPARGLVLRPRSWWIEQRLYKRAYKRKAILAGYGLPRSLAYLSLGWTRAPGGGFSFWFQATSRPKPKRGKGRARRGSAWRPWNPYRPRVTVRVIDGHRAIISFTGRLRSDDSDRDSEGRRWRGEFVDLAPVTQGLSGERLCLPDALAVFAPTERDVVQRPDSDESGSGPESTERVRAAIADTRERLALYEATRTEVERHPVDLRPARLYGGASLARAHLRDGLGLKPRRELDESSPQELGAAASACYGGRAQAAFVGVAPVRSYDMTAAYPMAMVNLGVWDLLCAQRVRMVDATAEVRRLLATVTPDDLLNPAVWRSLCGVARLGFIDPARPPLLPVRTRFGGEDSPPTTGLAYLTAAHPGLYTICHLLASKLLTGHVPPIEAAWGYVGEGHQRLKRVRVGGEGPLIDAARFPAELVEERARLKARLVDGRATPADRARELALKITLNSITGLLLQTEVQQPTATPLAAHRSPAMRPLRVHGVTGSFPVKTPSPEYAAHFYDPRLYGQVTGGGHLLLALAQHVEDRAGAAVLYMHTDSLLVAATPDGAPMGKRPDGGTPTAPRQHPVPTVSFGAADAAIHRLDSLSPWSTDAVPHVAKLEPENFPSHAGEREQCFAYIKGTNRVALYGLTAEGGVVVRKHSEHRFALRVDPTDPAAAVLPLEPGSPSLKAHGGGRRFVAELWRHLIEVDALGRSVPAPEWFDEPALLKLLVTHRDLAEAAGVEPYRYALRVPASWAEHATAAREGRAPPSLIAACADPRRWERASWRDLTTRRRVPGVWTERFDPQREIQKPKPPGRIDVETWGEFARRLRTAPETKMQPPASVAAIFDERRSWAQRDYRGPLVHSTISPAAVAYTGKESEHFEAVEEGLADLLVPDGVVQVFATVETAAADFVRDVLPVLHAAAPSRIARESGVPAGTVKHARKGRPLEPHARELLTSWAYEHLGEQLLAHGIEPATDAAQRFEQHRECTPSWLAQQQPEKGPAVSHLPPRVQQPPVRLCRAPGCGLQLTGRQRRWCKGHRRSGSVRASVARARATSFPVPGKAATAAATSQQNHERSNR
jgi:hypothetical protein